MSPFSYGLLAGQYMACDKTFEYQNHVSQVWQTSLGYRL